MIHWKNELTQLLKTQYPVVQAPMLGVTSPEMVAAVSNEGGLGSLPVGSLSPGKTLELIRRTKSLTTKPFAVNLFANENAAVDIPLANTMQGFLIQLCKEYSIDFEPQSPENLKFYSYTEQIQLLLDENIRVISFTFGILNNEAIQELKDNGAILIGTATCLQEAKILDEKGIDLITAQGIEAGGHRGTFTDGPLPQIGLISLLPQIAENIRKPVLAAGGIYDGKTIHTAFLLGASGVQIGSAFIAAAESIAIPSYKAAVQHAADTDTVLTKAFSGRWARGIKNTLITEVEKSGIKIPEYPVQVGLTIPIRIAAQKNDNKEFTTLWAGQSCSYAQAKPTAEIFRDLVKSAENYSNKIEMT